MFVKINEGLKVANYSHKKLYLKCERGYGFAPGILMAAGKWQLSFA